MTQDVHLPLWLFMLIVAFAAVTFASHFLFPSVRWFFRKRLHRAVDRLNARLTRPIEPFKLTARRDSIQRLIYDPAVTEAVVAHAKRKSVPEEVAFEKARKYAREIVPSFSAFAYFGFGIRAARILANMMYNVRTGPDNLDIIAAIPKDATVVFIMNHRSNMDYVLVTYLAAKASALSYAVGEWARIWPLSRLIKSMGAYFIRRRARGVLYNRVLARYVHMATQAGVTQAIFPEGGLSLDGRLAPPKLGLLSFVVEAARQSERDVVFVPVAINYDRVLEDTVLIAANERGDRRFSARISVVAWFSLLTLWRRLCGRSAQYGEAAVVFGDPLSMRDLSSGPTDKAELESLATDLMARIHAAMPYLGLPLLACLLKTQSTPQTEADLIATAREIMTDYRARFLLAPEEDPTAQLTAAISQLHKRRLIQNVDGILSVPDEARAVLEYYAAAMPEFSAIAKGDAAPAGL